MIDLHTHTLFSDGDLIPSELVRRAEVLGLSAIALTDHGDGSNIEWIIPKIVSVAAELNRVLDIKIIPGIEITHVPPALIPQTVKKARELGAAIIVVHGETIAEPVAPGTNSAAVNSDVDILAHPGLILPEDVIKAREKNIYLEISARKGHCLANGHVARLAKAHNAPLILNTDTHSPGDLITLQTARNVALGAGLSEGDFMGMQENSKQLVQAKYVNS